MANTAKETPTRSHATRSDSEIAFVLRRAKWRQGPEVLRALAGADTSAPEAKPLKPAKAPRQRAKDR
jgi:hypothetical protein